ncbi:DUF262 domain-containing protein [Chitinophaga sp. YR627]|uniref:DUF262 domain-containing protein n=1 Tax=Chitinophaga sp. YR627 TaxID=1881041 RepID=UPI000B7EAC69|nr:DUF262 domain-containing protein [Chitinophaga sp. YR627]
MSDSKLQSLTEIFNQKFFRIPDFQRGYSWEEPQLDDFWEDIQNLKSDRLHYTGVVTVEPVKRELMATSEKWKDDLWLIQKGLTAYYIIDGQQRLTTAIIFINELLKCFKQEDWINFDKKDSWVDKFLYKQYRNNYQSFVFGYEKDNPSDEYFKTKILEQTSSTADKVPEQTLYTSNLQYAKIYFSKKFQHATFDQLEDWFKKVINNFRFNFYVIDDDLDVYVTFETMNNRGKPLSNLELLKNRLIYISTLLNEDTYSLERLRKDINETWKTIYEYLGKNKEAPLDDDMFLYNHWIMYFKYDRSEAESYAKFLLKEKFVASAVLRDELKLPEIRRYIDSLAACVKTWFYLYNPGYLSYSDETKEWVQKLNRLGMGAFPPLLMAVMAKEKVESKVLRLLQTAERFIFLVFRISQRSPVTKNSHFYRLASQYYHGQEYRQGEATNIDHIVAEIQWYTNGESGDGENYQYHGYFELNKFKDHIMDLQEEGFYSWNGIKYFLYEYELHLQQKAQSDKKITWTDIERRKKDETIEHIYPQTATDSCWKDVFDIYDRKQKFALLHSLGNLLLLAHSKNSELQNRCFPYKCRHENRFGDFSGYFSGSYSEIEVSSFDNWTPVEIMERGRKMLDFMDNRWSIDFDDWGVNKDSLLGLDFLTEKKEEVESFPA